MTFALLFQEYSLYSNSKGSLMFDLLNLKLNGPFSVYKPSMDEQPGPPWSQIINGSLAGSDLDSAMMK